MKVLLVSLFFSTVSAICPSGSIQGLVEGNCYTVGGHSLSWKDADLMCQQKGGHLASLTSILANTFVQSVIEEIFADGVWTGGYYEDVQGEWAWADGKPWKFTNWAKACNKPNGNCAALNATSGQWTAVNCTTALPYLCEVPPVGGWSNPITDSPPSPTPKPCPAGWFKTRLIENPFCYLMVQKEVTWKDAFDACRAYGGDLASITSVDIQQELFLHVVGMETWIGIAYIGFVEYQWADGSPVVYTHWKDNSGVNPSNYPFGYMSTNEDGRWGIANSNGKYYYICQGDPNKTNKHLLFN
jgi:C-type mannose receptor